MSEEEGQSAPDTGGVALGLAIDEAKSDPSLRGEVAAFLRDQRSLVAEQRRHLHAQFIHLGLGIWEKRMGVLLRIATAFVGLAVAAGLAALLWQASQSNGLRIEAFSVPPDLAQRGLTGDVMAAKLLDRLALMQSQTSSQRASKSYANSWDENGIKLDIPETGVSLAELDNFLRAKLGHDVHVSGEIVRTATGITLTARVGTDGADSVSGPESDIDGLMQKLTESIFRLSQPYRYGVYLSSHGRANEAVAVFQAIVAARGPAFERAFGYQGWSNAIVGSRGFDERLRLLRLGLAIFPGGAGMQRNIAWTELAQGKPEQSVRDGKAALALLASHGSELFNAELIPGVQAEIQAMIDVQTGAFLDAARNVQFKIDMQLPGSPAMSADLATAYIGAHDLAAARAALNDTSLNTGISPGFTELSDFVAGIALANAGRDWKGALARAGGAGALLQQFPGLKGDMRASATPLIATARARLGDVAGAESLIAATPADCDNCLRTRARIAELRGQHARADFWFARAIQSAPSIPFAYADMGSALLARGKPDEAIAQFTIANEKGPHFADPLEGWGEALMAKNQSHLALEKFKEAEKYAPNWGRLHLKWGEALTYAGKPAEAKAQFARARQLDLTPAEKSELARRP